MIIASCLFFENEKDSCPLSQLRNSLSFDEKYDYVMELSAKEVHNLVEQHEECYEKRILALMQS